MQTKKNQILAILFTILLVQKTMTIGYLTESPDPDYHDQNSSLNFNDSNGFEENNLEKSYSSFGTNYSFNGTDLTSNYDPSNVKDFSKKNEYDKNNKILKSQIQFPISKKIKKQTFVRSEPIIRNQKTIRSKQNIQSRSIIKSKKSTLIVPHTPDEVRTKTLNKKSLSLRSSNSEIQSKSERVRDSVNYRVHNAFSVLKNAKTRVRSGTSLIHPVRVSVRAPMKVESRIKVQKREKARIRRMVQVDRPEPVKRSIFVKLPARVRKIKRIQRPVKKVVRSKQIVRIQKPVKSRRIVRSQKPVKSRQIVRKKKTKTTFKKKSVLVVPHTPDEVRASSLNRKSVSLQSSNSEIQSKSERLRKSVDYQIPNPFSVLKKAQTRVRSSTSALASLRVPIQSAKEIKSPLKVQKREKARLRKIVQVQRPAPIKIPTPMPRPARVQRIKRVKRPARVKRTVRVKKPIRVTKKIVRPRKKVIKRKKVKSRKIVRSKKSTIIVPHTPDEVRASSLKKQSVSLKSYNSEIQTKSERLRDPINYRVHNAFSVLKKAQTKIRPSISLLNSVRVPVRNSVQVKSPIQIQKREKARIRRIVQVQRPEPIKIPTPMPRPVRVRKIVQIKKPLQIRRTIQIKQPISSSITNNYINKTKDINYMNETNYDNSEEEKYKKKYSPEMEKILVGSSRY